MKNIKSGSIIKGDQWSEPIEVKLIEEEGDYIHLVGVTINSQTHIDQLIPSKEMDNFTLTEAEELFSEDPEKVFLALETIRYKFASLYDPLLAINTSKIDPLPHQIDAVYGYILKLPRIRFLLADDAGAGKTIMAGLIIKELKLRGLIKRILIVAPGHLKDQWKRELSDKFKENFVPIARSYADAFYGENVWVRENQIITSIDFIKREDILPSISAAHFDLVIVDEAHKMSAYKYGKKIDKTSRYKLGKSLSKITEHLLFLTATPHKGDPENFHLFLDLLEPGFFATTNMIKESLKDKDNPLFIRRIKEDMNNFEGEPLFLPRNVLTKTFNLGIESPNEKELYNKLSKYVNTQYNLAIKKDKKRNIAFALIILQRRLASSTYALLQSLKRRKKRLTELLEGAQRETKTPEYSFDFESVEDLNESDRWQEEEIWETLSVAENREELKKEIKTIEGLINDARKVIEEEEEIKLKELKKSLNELEKKYSDPKDKKILIFTESRDTLEYLDKKIRNWGYITNTIHGGMKLEERIKSESIFKNQTQILIATEAAGEGINLQFCHLMVNYDLPWNPNRLEQRMGRIHRYGQQKEVFIFNLVAEDTREGKVLRKLFRKLQEIKEALGSDKVFDCIGEVFFGENLFQLFLDAATNARNMDEILESLEIKPDEEYIAKVKENLGESLATRFIDYTWIKEKSIKAKEYRLIPEYTETYFKKAFNKAGGKYRELKKDSFISIDSIPFEIRKISSEDNFKKSYGQLIKSYPKITFDKEIAFKTSDAEFVSLGHPLFEAMMSWTRNNCFPSLIQGTTFIDPDGKMNGYLLFYEGEIKDGSGNIAGKRLFSFYVGNNEVISVPPSIIWDLGEGKKEKQQSIDIDEIKKNVRNKVIQKLEEYKNELYEKRNHQAKIKEKYGIKSLDIIRLNLDKGLISLYDRKSKGENVDLAIRNKEIRKKEYENALEDLKEQIKKEKTLTLSMPRFVSIQRVKPKAKIPDNMKSDEEIEKIGMKVAMEYERKCNRYPEDVSLENLGFDIRSQDKEGNLRYIEVKARAKTGPVALTKNEWFKAQRFKEDYYLYAVMNAAKSPKLFIIKDPSSELNPEEKIEVVRYVVSYKDITRIGELRSE